MNRELEEKARLHLEVQDTGLGLPITRELVERMDGRIHVHSTLGEGTTVILRFNLEEVTDATEDPANQPDGLPVDGVYRGRVK